jgi:hypothetical protein
MRSKASKGIYILGFYKKTKKLKTTPSRREVYTNKTKQELERTQRPGGAFKIARLHMAADGPL